LDTGDKELAHHFFLGQQQELEQTSRQRANRGVVVHQLSSQLLLVACGVVWVSASAQCRSAAAVLRFIPSLKAYQAQLCDELLVGVAGRKQHALRVDDLLKRRQHLFLHLQN
jgi:hypothetical protein